MDINVTVNLVARDLRFMRAAHDVLKRYRFHRLEPASPGDPIRFRVEGGRKEYQITINPRWAAKPACTCPDAAQQGGRLNGGYCKHIIAVLIREEALQYQLLEILL
ncbi:MAG TPA: SWIM zinc finger domain-containing protein [Myxococcota bacterium]|nr:SWIM zinc finger domain-containing protein [Myxococcota bacterium]HPB51067.1 SWIM zinc finger domain-containing protein [Myxococcota bacterium]HQP96648.1 SWIM zinc finger domain-containing protein [Myxococcota bacterium]